MSRLSSVHLESSESLQIANFSGSYKLRNISVQVKKRIFFCSNIISKSPFKPLWALNLAETAINDSFVEKFSDSFPNLRILNLSNTDVSEAGIYNIKLLELRQ